jgi:hypothetical protein
MENFVVDESELLRTKTERSRKSKLVKVERHGSLWIEPERREGCQREFGKYKHVPV